MCWSLMWQTWHGHPRSGDGIYQHKHQSPHLPGIKKLSDKGRTPCFHIRVRHRCSCFSTQLGQSGSEIFCRATRRTFCVLECTETKRKPKHALSFVSTEYVIQFLHTYAEQHALLPGRIPGCSRSDIQLLPSSVSKCKVWWVYWSRQYSPCCSVHHLMSTVEYSSAINRYEATIWALLRNVSKIPYMF